MLQTISRAASWYQRARPVRQDSESVMRQMFRTSVRAAQCPGSVAAKAAFWASVASVWWRAFQSA